MLVIRQPTLDDAFEIARVHAESWQTAYRGIVPDEFLDSIEVDVWAERHRRNMAEDPAGLVSYVAVIESEIVGWALGGPNREEYLDYAGELFTIYLLPGHLRRGIGRKLIAVVAESLLGLGFESMLVWVLAENWPARKFYEAQGGIYLGEQAITIGGASLKEVSYGWKDVRALLTEGR